MDGEAKARKRLEQQIYWDVASFTPDTRWGVIRKMLAEPNYAQSVIRKHLHFVLPRPPPVLTTDRLVLEGQIFRYYQSQPHIRDVLFVGCDGDTANYEKNYFGNVRFVTLEPDPDNRKFGAAHHVTAPLERLTKYFAAETFDLIICNGVFGWGLDELDACEAAFDQCLTCLREGGQLLLGWNDVPRRKPFPLEQIRSLTKFRKYDFPLFGTWRYMTDTVYRHVFDFYVK